MFKFIKLFLVALCIGNLANAQNTPKTSLYDPHALFNPSFYPSGGSVTRSADGSPNVGYWQNRADYNLTASLNDVTNEITCSAIITYKNNSPHTLPFLWLQLDQNLFSKDSRGQARMPYGVTQQVR